MTPNTSTNQRAEFLGMMSYELRTPLTIIQGSPPPC